MAETDIRDLADRIQSALRRRVDAFPEEAEPQDYANVLSQVRALRALTNEVQRLDDLVASGDSSAERARDLALSAMRELTQELGR